MVGRSEATLAQVERDAFAEASVGKFTLVAQARSGAVRLNLCEAAGVSHVARPAIAGGVALQHPGCYCAGCFSWCSGAVLPLSGAAVRRATFCFASLRRRSGCCARSLVRVCGERRKTGTRTWVARVRSEYPNQLDYSGFALSVCVRAWVWVLPLLARVLVPCAARRRRA